MYTFGENDIIWYHAVSTVRFKVVSLTLSLLNVSEVLSKYRKFLVLLDGTYKNSTMMCIRIFCFSGVTEVVWFHIKHFSSNRSEIWIYIEPYSWIVSRKPTVSRLAATKGRCTVSVRNMTVTGVELLRSKRNRGFDLKKMSNFGPVVSIAVSQPTDRRQFGKNW